MSESKDMVLELLSPKEKHDEQLKMGIEVEKEHDPTIDKIEQKYNIEFEDREEVYSGIAEDHLDEFNDYYDRLEAMENEAEAELKASKGE